MYDTNDIRIYDRNNNLVCYISNSIEKYWKYNDNGDLIHYENNVGDKISCKYDKYNRIILSKKYIHNKCIFKERWRYYNNIIYYYNSDKKRIIIKYNSNGEIGYVYNKGIFSKIYAIYLWFKYYGENI